ncbi:three-Cys-motif partner protein TcmP [Ralstonia sp. TCR112]|uniref:three-Cys-motif partner protein TcmP n=1 Tax=unclassified Ralstonia TaxID=209769 RepID=UPI0011BE1ABA|nr:MULTISPECIES: three-Cys-motif partner protein TcmP [unclassified Ralstonia]TXD58297.1 three-Cys-motif partner protein TcmP [Ralstonia sp. TCR112]HWV04069.1 three-Cys-motif partner protein TcmP [Ralstonia sp.]
MPHYKWVWGSPPPQLKRHSEVKHALLRNYLVDYFLTLVSLPHQDKIQLTIVDGFCGGGLYLNEDGQEVPGSPLVILEAIREAETLLNIRQERRKPILIDVELICVDAKKSSLHYLGRLLEERGYGAALANGKVRLVKGQFADHCGAAIQRCHDRSPRSGRALFVLDQYGYSGVPMQCLRDIFAKLKHAEVILTFYIDALIKYLNERNLAAFQKATGVSTSVRASELDEIKQSPRWRVHLQSSLYQNLTNQCSAQFYTPFFIRPERGHGDFWLLHLSQHWKARDVMASTHWQHNNHFSHYGDAGFHMFSTGYISKIDDEHKLQAGFDFGEVAAAVSKETMLEQIPEMLFDGAEGMTFEQFFLKLINTTPATREMVEATLLELHQGGEIVVVDESGDPSRARVNLKGNHVLRLPSQRSFLFS